MVCMRVVDGIVDPCTHVYNHFLTEMLSQLVNIGFTEKLVIIYEQKALHNNLLQGRRNSSWGKKTSNVVGSRRECRKMLPPIARIALRAIPSPSPAPV